MRQFTREKELLAILDLNEDGRADLLTDDGFLLSNQSGSAGPVRTAFNATRYLAASDFDGDGDPDLLAMDADGAWLVWQINGGAAGVTDQVLVATGVEPYFGVVPDLNGDNIGDIVLQNFGPYFTMFLSTAPEVAIVESFVSDPPTLSARGTATLTWRVRGAESIRIDGGIGQVPAEGSAIVDLRETTEFTLIATAAGGAVTTFRLVVGMPLFQNPVVLAPPGSINQPGMVAGDIDSDGHVDLLFPNRFFQRVDVFTVSDGTVVEAFQVGLGRDFAGDTAADR
ncbi:MAG: VCBS repeat-containing protein [Verrucomicrobiales bacterium]